MHIAIFGNTGNYINGEIVKCQESFITFLYCLFFLNYSFVEFVIRVYEDGMYIDRIEIGYT